VEKGRQGPLQGFLEGAVEGCEVLWEAGNYRLVRQSGSYDGCERYFAEMRDNDRMGAQRWIEVEHEREWIQWLYFFAQSQFGAD
jgi:hypothetical protein